MYMTLCTTQQYLTHLHGHVLVKGNSHFNPHLTIKFILSNPTNNSDNTGILQVQNALVHERVNSTSIQELQFSKKHYVATVDTGEKNYSCRKEIINTITYFSSHKGREMYDYNIISIDYIKIGFQLPISEERQQKTDTCMLGYFNSMVLRKESLIQKRKRQFKMHQQIAYDLRY